MAKLAYCIAHEQLCMMESSSLGTWHEYYVCYGDGFEIDWCDFPLGWTTTEPIVDPDWEIDLVEPSEDELVLMNENAELLLLDFEPGA